MELVVAWAKIWVVPSKIRSEEGGNIENRRTAAAATAMTAAASKANSQRTQFKANWKAQSDLLQDGYSAGGCIGMKSQSGISTRR
jgi:hypothetical protein